MFGSCQDSFGLIVAALRNVKVGGRWRLRQQASQISSLVGSKDRKMITDLEIVPFPVVAERS